MTDGGPTDSTYERAARDEAFRSRIARAHRGSWDVLDALWWAEHPDSPSPSGREAPTRMLRDLEATAFGPHGERRQADGKAGLLRYLALADEIAREREAIAAAVTAAQTDAVEGDDESGIRSEPTTESGPHTEKESQTGSPSDAPAPEPSVTRRRPAVALLVGGAVAVGIVVGAVAAALVWGGGAAPLSSANDSATTDSVATDSATDSGPTVSSPEPGTPGAVVDASNALDIFEAPQQPTDIPPTLKNIRLRVETMRLLLGAPAPVYAARDIGGAVCLVLVQTSGAYTASCTTDDAFPADGLVIEGSYLLPDTSAGGSSGAYVDLTVRWLPSGQIGGGDLWPIPATG